MTKLSLISYIVSFIFIFSYPLFAEEIMEPEFIETVNHSLSSDPQPGVNYHVIKVCKDFEMIVDCKECTYEASVDGSLNIPTYNRCIFREEQETTYSKTSSDNQFYKFFYQFKAASNTGSESNWTEPKIASIVKSRYNESRYSYAYLFVQYNHE